MIVSSPIPTADELAVALEVMSAAKSAGVRFRIKHQELQFGPRSSVPPELRERLTEPTTRRILAALVAGDQEVADAIFAGASGLAAMEQGDFPPERVALLGHDEASLGDATCAREYEYDDYWLLMWPEDRRHMREKPRRRLPRIVPGTWLLDAWPASDREIPFGRRKGQRLGDVAATYEGGEYLKWIVAHGAGDADFRRDVRRVLADAGRSVPAEPEVEFHSDPEEPP